MLNLKRKNNVNTEVKIDKNKLKKKVQVDIRRKNE